MKNNKGATAHRVEFDRIESDKCVLYFEGGEEFFLPKKYLPKEASEGDSLNLTITTDEAETERREKKAKDLLNEILNQSK